MRDYKLGSISINQWVRGAFWWRLRIHNCDPFIGDRIVSTGDGRLVWWIDERRLSLANAMEKINEKKGSIRKAKGWTTRGERTHIEKTILRPSQASSSHQPS